MAVVAPESSAEKIIESSQSMEPSHSRRASDAASDSSSICATLDPSDQYNSSPNPHKDVEIQSLTSLRSEEYRQLFRLPLEEVLIQDFNCAFQENILLQGHMYVFSHYICFYSNIFGFETKKAIPYHEVTCVRRAKTAGIFPNAIEIIAGGKKNFFASFLSRDEAFKIINDGWLQHSNDGKAVTEQQDSISESISQENGLVVIEKVTNSKCSVTETDSVDRNKDAPILNDSNLPSKVEDDIVLTTLSELQNNVEEEAEPVLNSDSSSGKTQMWMEENSDAPKVPDCYTRVAETKFPIKVEDFFSFFYSDEAVNFIESFHRSCGDKDFRCTSWYPHDKFGHARDVSFQHPIKLYFGAKFGSCQEVQKFRVYRHSHLVIETSQEINDVPYGDYFRVEGLWDVERDGDESKDCCVLRVYVNVAFSKKTVWRGKIVQSTVEECREAYASWVNIAHELLKQKNFKKQEEGDPNACMIENDQVHFESQVDNGEHLERSNEANDTIRIPQMSDSKNVNQQVDNLVQGNLICSTSISSLFKESMVKFYSSVKSQGHLPLLLVIIFVVILLLMQLSIVALLTRPQQVHVISQADFMNSMGSGVGERSSEMLAWLEKRIYHLKDEILMVEARLEKMRQEHTLIKAQLKDLELLKKRI